jgi:N-acetylglucosaminyldiphosphoundecaprenol N-acetyl-beta-D-mannosaminyltransferase
MNRLALMEKITDIININEQEIILPINTSSLLFMERDILYRKIMTEGTMVCADGMSIVWAARICGIPVPERIATTDLVNYLFQYICDTDKSYKIFFLGGKESILINAETHFRNKYPKLTIAGHYSPPFMSLDEMKVLENEKIISLINSKDIDILFVGFGVPKQEKWCFENREKINASILIPCGGMFGFYGGEYSRAPVCIQKIGFEWFFRLCQEPKRLWKRYLQSNSLFIWLTLKAFISYLLKKLFF